MLVSPDLLEAQGRRGLRGGDSSEAGGFDALAEVVSDADLHVVGQAVGGFKLLGKPIKILLRAGVGDGVLEVVPAGCAPAGWRLGWADGGSALGVDVLLRCLGWRREYVAGLDFRGLSWGLGAERPQVEHVPFPEAGQSAQEVVGGCLVEVVPSAVALDLVFQVGEFIEAPGAFDLFPQPG